MRATWILAAILSTAAMAAQDDPKAEIVEISVTPKATPTARTEPLDISHITFNLITKDMGESEWQKFVSKVELRFKDWSREYDNNNRKQFLDDRLIALATGVQSGKGPALREFCQWLALYKVFAEPIPRYIRDLSEEDKRWIRDELQDFDWNRVALKIKENAKK
jgi:hypothetical protein